MTDSVRYFVKKKIQVPAVQWTGENFDELLDFTQGNFQMTTNLELIKAGFSAEVYDKLHKSWPALKVGQWVMSGPLGEFYPMDEDALAVTYNEVDPGTGESLV